MHIIEYQREAVVAAQNGDVNNAGVVGDAETVALGRILLVVEGGHERYAPDENAERHHVRDASDTAPETVVWNHAHYPCAHNHNEYLNV